MLKIILINKYIIINKNKISIFYMKINNVNNTKIVNNNISKQESNIELKNKTINTNNNDNDNNNYFNNKSPNSFYLNDNNKNRYSKLEINLRKTSVDYNKNVLQTEQNLLNNIKICKYNENTSNRNDTYDYNCIINKSKEDNLDNKNNIEEKEINDLNFNSYKMFNIYLLVMNSSLGFFFMGYNLGVFNTMITSMRIIFKWDLKNIETLTSICSAILPIGALFGGISAGLIAKKIGRRFSLMLFDVLGLIGACIAIIGNTTTYLIGRFIMGLAVGCFSAVVPVYIKEYVPKTLIGKFGVFNFSFFCLGVVISFLLGLPLSKNNEDLKSYNKIFINNNNNTTFYSNTSIYSNNSNITNNIEQFNNFEYSNFWWRFMILFPCIISLINFILLIFVFKKDTPIFNFLYLNNEENTVNSLSYIYSDSREIKILISNFKALKAHLLKQKGSVDAISYSELFSKKYSIRLILGILLNVGQQFSGINTFTFYSNIIYIENEPNVNATLYSSFLSFAEVLGNLLSIFVIEKLGRRLLFLVGFGSVFFCLLSMTILYYLNVSIWAHKYIVIIYYFFAGMSTDPIIWILSADLLPEIGVGICATINWISAIIIIVSFPYMMNKNNLGLSHTHLIYTICTFVFWCFMFTFLKETKNKSYIEIEKMYLKWF